MRTLTQQLVDAYRREESLYRQINGLVAEQTGVLAQCADARAVLALCEQIEALMAQIGDIEEAIEPAKARWEESREDPDGELHQVLTSIEELIHTVSQAQQQVQDGLLSHMEQQKERTENARRSINANKARQLYRAG